MYPNRVKEFLGPTGCEELPTNPEEEQIEAGIDVWSSLVKNIPTGKKQRELDEEVGEQVKAAVEKFLIELNSRVADNEITQLQQQTRALERTNQELRDRLNTLEELIYPLAESLEEEKRIEEKLKKEMPELEFEKRDPFIFTEDGWALPHEQLKKLLEEE